MVNFRVAAASAIALVASANAATLTINSPTSLITCEPSALSWSGGTAPYYVTILPGGEASATALETLESNSTATSVTWTVDITAGTYITLALKDSTGAIAYSSAVEIQAGSSTSCVTVTNTVTEVSSGSTTAAGTTTAATTTAASSSKSSGTASTSSASKSASSGASSASASSTSTASSATKLVGGAGVATLLAALAMVLA